MNLQSVLEELRKVAVISQEYPANAFSEFKESYEGLLESYPALTHYPDYLEFLKTTGGAHIHNQEFSLGIYGFGGYEVTSFDEGLFLDQERFFHFGEVLYHAQPDPVYVFAFDLRSEVDKIYTSPIERSDYTLAGNSFLELLANFSTKGHSGFRK